MLMPSLTPEVTTVRQQMDQLTLKLMDSLEAEPDNFDARETMWMERENLRAGL